jgi:hypothetical protein
MKILDSTFYKATSCLFKIKTNNKNLNKNSNITSIAKIYQLTLFKKFKNRKIKFKIVIKKFLKLLYIFWKKDSRYINLLHQTILIEFLTDKLLKPFSFFYFKKEKNIKFNSQILQKTIKKILSGILLLLIDNLYDKNFPYFQNQMIYLLFQIFFSYPEQEYQFFKLFLKKTENMINFSYSRYSSIFKIAFNKSKCMRFFLISEIVIFLKIHVSKFYLCKKLDKINKIFINFTKNTHIKKIFELIKKFKLKTYSKCFKIKKNTQKNQINNPIFNIKLLINLQICKYFNYKLFDITTVNRKNVIKYAIYINIMLIFIFEFFNFKFYFNYYLYMSIKIDPLYLTSFSENYIFHFLSILKLSLKHL